MLPEIIIAQAADIESDSFMPSSSGLDAPLREQSAAGGSQESVKLPFQVYIISQTNSILTLGVTKGFINGNAVFNSAGFEVASNFSGGVYLAVYANDSYAFVASATALIDTASVGYIRIADISNATITNLRTTSFDVRHCGDCWAFYAV